MPTNSTQSYNTRLSLSDNFIVPKSDTKLYK